MWNPWDTKVCKHITTFSTNSLFSAIAVCLLFDCLSWMLYFGNSFKAYKNLNWSLKNTFWLHKNKMKSQRQKASGKILNIKIILNKRGDFFSRIEKIPKYHIKMDNIMYLDDVSLGNTSPGGHPDLISIQLFHCCDINTRTVTSHIIFLFWEYLCLQCHNLTIKLSRADSHNYDRHGQRRRL